MKFQKSTDSFKKILTIIIGVVFVVSLAVITYKVMYGNTKSTLSAEQAQSTYKRWDSTKDAGGWIGQNLSGLVSQNGILRASIGSKTGSIVNSAVNTSIPAGNKYISFRMAVVSGANPVSNDNTDCVISSGGTETCVPAGNNLPESAGGARPPGGGLVPPETPFVPPTNAPCVPRPTCPAGTTICPLPLYYPIGGWCPQGTSPGPTGTPIPTVTPYSRPFSFRVYYWKNIESLSAPSASQPIILNGVADGALNSYLLRIPDFGALTIAKIEIRFDSGVAAGDQVQFDAITLVGPVKPTSTLTPPPDCYYMTVQCVKAPCPPVLVCPTPTL